MSTSPEYIEKQAEMLWTGRKQKRSRTHFIGLVGYDDSVCHKSVQETVKYIIKVKQGLGLLTNEKKHDFGGMSREM